MRILGIETSCDETGIAIYDENQGLMADKLYSQIALHEEYGGVVPELASRDHIRKTLPMIDDCLTMSGSSYEDIDAIAYTSGPGLVGALLVGSSVAKSLAFAWDKPAIGVHHMEGHLLASMMIEDGPEYPLWPSSFQVVTHSYWPAKPTASTRYWESIDDAAGEAFDKVAKMLELGYPGGPAVANLATQGASGTYKFPKTHGR